MSESVWDSEFGVMRSVDIQSVDTDCGETVMRWAWGVEVGRTGDRRRRGWNGGHGFWRAPCPFSTGGNHLLDMCVCLTERDEWRFGQSLRIVHHTHLSVCFLPTERKPCATYSRRTYIMMFCLTSSFLCSLWPTLSAAVFCYSLVLDWIMKSLLISSCFLQ